MKHLFVIVVLVAPVLVACASSNPSVGARKPFLPENVAGAMQKSFEKDEKISISQLNTKISNQTIRTYSPAFGTQIEYHGADGRTALWFHGNRRIVHGRWRSKMRVIPSKLSGKKYAIPMLCYTYGSNTYNPVTKKRGGKEKCIAASIAFKRLKGARKGDVFRLAGRTGVPFVMQKKQYSFSDLVRKVN